MTINNLLADLSRRGIQLWADGDRLRFRAPHADALDDKLREAIGVHRRELLDLLSAVQFQPAAQPLPRAEARDGAVRCSHAQERFLFSAELDDSSNPYRLDAAFRILGTLDVAALEWSIREIVRRHEVLRSRFDVCDGGFQMSTTGWEPVLETSDFTGTEADLLATIVPARLPEFDLKRGPHLVVKLYRLASDRHVLLISMHHLVSDGGSIGIFARELQSNYAWRVGLIAQPPPSPKLQFRDIAAFERKASDHYGPQLDFWKRELEGAPTVLTLPTDRPRPTVRAGVGGSIPLEIEPALWEKLQEFRKVSRVSEFQVVVAALWLLLHKYSGQESVVIGTPWRNRVIPGSENVIGPLLNILPLHIHPGREASIRELLEEVKARTLTAMEYGQIPFEKIVSHLSPERSTAHTPIFQVMCAIEPTPTDVIRLAGLAVESIELPNVAARYDLAVVLQPAAESLRGALKYDCALFDAATAQAMAQHLIRALTVVLEQPEASIARAQLMSGPDMERLLHEWNNTDHVYPLDKTLVDFFHDRVEESPDHVAVEYQGRSLTYGELNNEANRVASRLLKAGVRTDDVIGITLDRELELVVAILGVVKAGAAYLAIDAQQPPERRNWMLNNANVKAVIGPAPDSIPQILLGGSTADEPAPPNPECRSCPDSACYVIYTSGSTGLPKGVVVDHRAIANNLLWMNEEWPLTEDDAVLFKSSPGFDVSVKEIFWPLITGARLVIAPQGVSADPERLGRIIRDSRISVVHMVPTVLDFFLQQDPASPIPHLRIVMCGGEALSPSLRARFHERFDALLLHLYGPTEAAIAVTGYAITPQHAEVERLPLGKPMPNCRIYVVDSSGQPVPNGVPGELCIGGIPLARGYIGQPGLTAEKFVPDPFSGRAGERLYLTGDRARWRRDGQLEYFGRIDRQIKLGGFRIEPGEIESVLRMQPGIDDALVVVREETGNRALVAYVASRSPDISTVTLQQGLRERLPAFMVPASFIILPAFPVNINGKVDRTALPPPDTMPARRSINPPQGELEEQIAGIWRELLNVEAVDRDEDFFELGGHSLLVLQLQAKLRDELGAAVSLKELFLHSTVANFAAHLSESTMGRTRRWLRRALGSGKGSAN